MSFLQLLAQTKIDPGAVGIPNVSTTPDNVLWSILSLVYISAGIVAVIVIIIAGYIFATSVYDPAKVTKAKNSILYAVVGLIVVGLAFTITALIMGKF